LRLTTVHQLLIGAAIALGALFAVRAVILFAGGGGKINVALALAGVALAVGGLAYLRRFRRKLRGAEGG
jgi:LPXTG-motif cell wall-anchored protein